MQLVLHPALCLPGSLASSRDGNSRNGKRFVGALDDAGEPLRGMMASNLSRPAPANPLPVKAPTGDLESSWAFLCNFDDDDF